MSEKHLKLCRTLFAPERETEEKSLPSN